MLDASEINSLLLADHGETFRYIDSEFSAVFVVGTARIEEQAPLGIDQVNAASLTVRTTTGIDLHERDRVTRLADSTEWTVTQRLPTEAAIYKCVLHRTRNITQGRL